MRLNFPRRLFALVSSVILTGWVVSCAKDAGIGDNPDPVDGGGEASDSGGAGGTGGTSGSGGGGGWPTAGFGTPCKQDGDCTSGKCVDVGNGKANKVCTGPCSAGKPCPDNGYCAWQASAGYVCVPDNKNQCTQCATTADCKNTGDRCVTSPKFDHFCGRDCSFDGLCPTGSICTSPDAYGPKGGGADGGVPDAGGTTEGGATEGGTTEGGTGDAGATPNPPRICVPDKNDSCPCDTAYDGQTRTCTKTSGTATCGGKETCNGSSGAWEGCTASTPQPEVCDGADNDCDGVADNGTDAVLCAAEGAAPIHSGGWVCDKTAGQCEPGNCDAGWAHYPANLPPSAGCACKVEAADQDPDPTKHNDTCANATPSGSVSDANLTALNISGRLTSDTDEDWYSFDTVDADNGTQNDYHVKIQFTAPIGNSEFEFDVIRGDTCATPDAKHSNLATYDWCVDGTGTDASGTSIGEASCGAATQIHCGPHDKTYLIRVHRKAGVTGTCSEYTLTITAKGGGACDFTQATGSCDSQVTEN